MRLTNKKRLGFIVALILALTASLAACGGDTPAADSGTAAPPPAADSGSSEAAPAADTNEDISGTISLYMQMTDEPGMKLVIEDFETAYPNCKVEPEYVSDLTAFHTQGITRLAAGNAADMIHLIGGGSQPLNVWGVAEAGYLLDLSNESWVSGMYEASKPLMMYDDKVVAKDFGFSPIACLQYNKKFFADNNLTPPTTFEELLALCEEIKALGVTPISWGAATPAINVNNATVMCANYIMTKDPDWFDKRLAGETTFAETEGWKTGFEQLKQLIDMEAFGPGASAMPMADMIANFATGKAAMMFTTSILSAQVTTQTPDMEIGMVVWPATNAEDSYIMVQAAGGVGLNAESQNLDAAKVFLDFWSQPEESAKFVDALNIISADQASSGNLSPVYSEMKDVFAAGKTLPDITALWPNATFRDKMAADIQGLFTGQVTIDQLIANADTYFDEE